MASATECVPRRWSSVPERVWTGTISLERRSRATTTESRLVILAVSCAKSGRAALNTRNSTTRLKSFEVIMKAYRLMKYHQCREPVPGVCEVADLGAGCGVVDHEVIETIVGGAAGLDLGDDKAVAGGIITETGAIGLS